MNQTVGPEFPIIQKIENSPLLDWKRVAFTALRYWYIVVISLFVAFGIAFYKNRYTPRVYPVSASVIIREREETTGGELLYKNGLVDQYRNYLNEPYIIRSYPLIERVVENLGFNISFYREGYILTTESYALLPIRVKPISPRKSDSNGKYVLTLLTENTFTLEEFDKQTGSPRQFNIGDTITSNRARLFIEKVEGSYFNDHLNHPYILIITDPFDVASEYVGKLNVKWAEEGAGVIDLTVNGLNPQKEIDFLNGLINEYQHYDLEKKNLTADRTAAFIKGQLNKISDSLRLFEGQLQQFKKDNRTSGDLSNEARHIYDRIEQLEIQKGELLIKTNYYDYLKKYIGNSKNLEMVILPSSLGINDPILTAAISKLVDLQMEIKLYYDREKTLNPLVETKMLKFNEIKREIVQSLENLKETDKIKRDFIDKQLATVEKQMGYLPVAERQLITIRRNYSLLENLYVFLMQKMSEAEISKASNVSDIIMVNPPLAGGAISPQPSQNNLIALLLGLGLPAICFVLLELVNNKIQSKEDVEKFTSIPFIGGVGRKKGNTNLEVFTRPKTSIAESFRGLRSNLNYFFNKQEKAIILITSSISGEGKTFTAINLASVFNLSGKRTLIVGADMRRPKLYVDFNLNNDTGLSTYLAGKNSFEEVVQHTPYKNLDLISGGPVPPNPAELLLKPEMETFIAKARAEYEFVIIDTPPLGLVTDAFVLAGLADHTLFVVRQDYTPRNLLRTVQDFYKNGKLKNISIVLNDIYRSGPGYGYGYGYGYGSGYGYGYGYGYLSAKGDSAYYSES